MVWALAALVLLEFSISLTDTLLEDRTRPLSALERTMHVVLLVPVLMEWYTLPTAALAWCLRDALSYVTRGKRVRQESMMVSA